MGRYKQYRFDRNKVKLLGALVIVLVIAAIGTYLLVSSHAATPFTSTTAASGTLAKGAANCSAASTSSGSSVVFSSAVPTDGKVALALSCSGTPFAANSFWNTPIPDNAPINTNNAAYISDIDYDLCNYYPIESSPTNPCVIPAYGGLNTNQYSAPLYVVPADQPYVMVTRACGGVATPSTNFDNSVAGGVPIPADAHAAVGTDEEIQIYQPSTDKYWDFWRLQKDSSGNWDACWGGGITNVSTSNGIFPNNLGATATSLPLLGGDVRIEELQAGEINHVMGLELDNNLSKTVIPANTPGATTGISWPASRGDGTDTSPTAIPEGLRFRLNPNLDLNTLDLSPVAKVIAIAAQKYGFVVNDTTNGLGIYLGDPTTYTAAGLPNPYTTGPGVGGEGTTGLFQGVPQYLVLKNFPWDQLQALPFNYGEPSSP